MCMTRCDYCRELVDTDEQPDAIFDTDEKLDVLMCDQCREYSDLDHELNHLANMADLARAS